MKYKKFFVIMLVMVLAGSLLSILSPILINIWSGDNLGLTPGRLAILAGVLLLTALIQFLLTVVRERYAKSYNIHNTTSMLNSFFKLKYDIMNNDGAAEISNKIATATNSIYMYMTGDAIHIWSSVVVMLVILFMIGKDSLIVAVVMVLLIPFNYFGYKLLNKSLLEKSKKLTNDTASGWQGIMSIMDQTDYVKQCSSYDEALKYMQPYLDRIYGSMADINVFAQGVSKILSSVNNVVNIMLLAYTVYNVSSSNGNAIVLIMYCILLPLYFSSLSYITNANLNKRDYIVAQDFIKYLKGNEEPNGTVKVDSIDTVDIDMDSLEIAGRKLTGRISEHYKKGDVVWICGESGVGKSTFVKLLSKFRESAGISINKTALNMIENESLRSKLDYLSQNVPIIKGTIRDNLFFNRKYDSELEQKIINDPIMISLLEGKTMDTQINEGGTNLSGGEKQKLAIARAINDDVDLLILDEITSNIDKKSADAILSRMLKDRDKRITFIITHDELAEEFYNKKLVLQRDIQND